MKARTVRAYLREAREVADLALRSSVYVLDTSHPHGRTLRVTAVDHTGRAHLRIVFAWTHKSMMWEITGFNFTMRSLGAFNVPVLATAVAAIKTSDTNTARHLRA